MSNQTYVIRGYHFGYNDECFYVCGSYIKNIYHDKEEAEQTYRALEIEYLRNANLCELGNIFDAEDNLLQQLDEYVFAKTGVHILEKGYVEYGVSLPSQMSDGEVLEFAQLADIHAYNLVEFKERPVFYALWDSKEEQYQQEFDEYYTSLVYASSREATMKNLESLIEDKGWQTLKIAGTLDELSLHPLLLEQLIKTNKCFSYDVSQPALSINQAQAHELAALNELLKKPLFEVRELEPESIMKLEKKLGHDYYEE